jgi:hypothetical protein
MNAHEARGVDEETLAGVSAQWGASPDCRVRAASIEIHALRRRRDVEAIEALLLRDPAPMVRSVTATRIGELLEPEMALLLVVDALRSEGNREVQIELFHAHAELLGKQDPLQKTRDRNF